VCCKRTTSGFGCLRRSGTTPWSDGGLYDDADYADVVIDIVGMLDPSGDRPAAPVAVLSGPTLVVSEGREQ